MFTHSKDGPNDSEVTNSPKINTSSFKLFAEYAKSLDVDVDDLASSTTAGCHEQVLESVRGGAIIHAGRRGGCNSIRSNHRSLRLAGIIHDLHCGIRAENVDWNRFDYLLSIRERVK